MTLMPSRSAKLVLMISMVLSGQGQSAENRCEDLFSWRAFEYKNQNVNASQSAEDYGQTNYRTLHDYEQRFATGFKNAIEGLDKNSLYIDSGSGISVAARTVAYKTSAQVIAINPQDYSEYFQILETPTQQLIEQILSPESEVIRRRDALANHHIVTGIKLPSGQLLTKMLLTFAKDVQQGKQVSSDNLPSAMPWTDTKVKKAFAKEVRSLHGVLKDIRSSFYYHVGYSQTALKQYKGKADLITDLFGAFYYSPERIELLRAIYEALKPGGQAYIHIGPVSKYKRDTVYYYRSRPKTNLVSWLTTTYPTIFRQYQRGFFTLTKSLESPVAFPPLEKQLKLIEEGIDLDLGHGYVVPSLTFQVIDPSI